MKKNQNKKSQKINEYIKKIDLLSKNIPKI